MKSVHRAMSSACHTEYDNAESEAALSDVEPNANGRTSRYARCVHFSCGEMITVYTGPKKSDARGGGGRRKAKTPTRSLSAVNCRALLMLNIN
ncbi:hypothetical protein ANCDUO_18852 [Ancylostoma duodenale]|uniref:Uncharacterized protein n=1 Tax=Ancylostoma duodenale TaxID=51022 RepID=A0A0C2FR73_9BILA|nr:hypothetical protein ANCDUO_18852 [Ancylostoma duodenale]